MIHKIAIHSVNEFSLKVAPITLLHFFLIFIYLCFCFFSYAGALCYSELGTLMPGKSGGEYQYLREAFGNVVAFLYAWTSVIVIRPSSLAIISLTFAEYASTVFSLCGTPQLPVKITAAVILGEGPFMTPTGELG